MEQPDFKNLNKLKEWILNIHEKYFVELKKAQELPAAFWESYSAFCNTFGGWILLGVIEDDPTNIISGVGNKSDCSLILHQELEEYFYGNCVRDTF